MPIIGWYVGYQVSDYVTTFDHWIAFILLFYIGSKMIYESSKEDEEKNGYNPSKGSKLILLSIATSIDALAVGLSLAFLKVEIFTPSLLIGIITATFSFLGVKIGRKFGKRYSQKAELLGGLILIGIGIKILIEHLSN
jgi:putative Mn2+ efflux pump MntP